MGFPNMVSPMLERQRVHETLDSMTGIQRDAEFQASEVYGLACNRNIVEACEEAARLLSSGDRVLRDVAKAEQFLVKTRAILEKACAPGAKYGSTYAPRLIQMYEKGEGGPRDIPRALALCEWLRSERANGACPALERLRTARP